MNLQVIKNIAYMFAIIIILLIIIFYNLQDSKNPINNKNIKLNFENLVDYTINIESFCKSDDSNKTFDNTDFNNLINNYCFQNDLSDMSLFSYMFYILSASYIICLKMSNLIVNSIQGFMNIDISPQNGFNWVVIILFFYGFFYLLMYIINKFFLSYFNVFYNKLSSIKPSTQSFFNNVGINLLSLIIALFLFLLSMNIFTYLGYLLYGMVTSSNKGPFLILFLLFFIVAWMFGISLNVREGAKNKKNKSNKKKSNKKKSNKKKNNKKKKKKQKTNKKGSTTANKTVKCGNYNYVLGILGYFIIPVIVTLFITGKVFIYGIYGIGFYLFNLIKNKFVFPDYINLSLIFGTWAVLTLFTTLVIYIDFLVNTNNIMKDKK